MIGKNAQFEARGDSHETVALSQLSSFLYQQAKHCHRT